MILKYTLVLWRRWWVHVLQSTETLGAGFKHDF
jgi:hypothetical protein